MSSLTSRRQIYCFPGSQRVPERSLLDLCLVTVTQNSDNDLLTGGSDFTDLPVHLRQYLLGYIAAYRSRCIAIGELQTLLQKRDTDSKNYPDVSSPTELRHLDLSGSIGSSVSFGQLNRFVAPPVLIDFTSLTHLCLARPGPDVSWRSFIGFILGANRLTHLSLAYWSLASFGTWFLTDYKLNLLNVILTKLQYLDVEGCNECVSALGDTDKVDWTGRWKSVHSLNLSQGPMPIEVQFEGGPETSKWIEGEVRVRQAEESINRVRRFHGLDVPPVVVEHGWNQKNCLIKTMIETAWEKRYGCRDRPG
ncbi:MAG: hypothetical protein Q9195_008039 [Heterodermia aff. obscurata]